MKKALSIVFMVTSLILALCFNISCNNQAIKVELEELKTQADVEAQNKALVRKYWERFGKDENAGIAISQELHASDIIFNTAQKNYGLNPYGDLSDFHPDIENIIAEGEFVVVRFIFRGTHSGDLLEIPATGMQVSYPVQIMYRFQDGKAQEAWSDWDSLFDLMKQLGMELKPREREK